MRRNIALACVTIGMAASSASHAQDAVPNLVPATAPEQATFTADVARDLAEVKRIRVELAFQGDTWTFVDARTEMGVPATYPDAEGFFRAEAVDAAGERLASVGLPDPRILRVYELSAGRDVRPLRRIPSEGPGAVVPRIAIDRPDALETADRVLQPAPLEPSAQPEAPPLSAPATIDRRGEPGRARLKFGADRFDEEVLRQPPGMRFRKLEAALTVPEQRRPPHQDVTAPEGIVVVYLPERPGSCTVRITIGPPPSPVSLTGPVRDLEGRPRRCR